MREKTQNQNKKMRNIGDSQTFVHRARADLRHCPQRPVCSAALASGMLDAAAEEALTVKTAFHTQTANICLARTPYRVEFLPRGFGSLSIIA
jgi:hypothetical protein